MLRVRSRISLAQVDEESLVVRSSIGRRVLFGSIGAMLLISFFVGSQSGSESQANALGTVFYFLITGVCVAVAAWNATVLFDRRGGTVEFAKSLFGVRVHSTTTPLAEIRSVALQTLHFLKESEQPRPNLMTNRFRGTVSRRNTYYRLFLETDQHQLLVEDASDLGDLDRAGQLISAFLGVTYRKEDI